MDKSKTGKAGRAGKAAGGAAARMGRPRKVVGAAGKAVEAADVGGRACSDVYLGARAKLEEQLARLGELMDTALEAGEVMAVKNLATAQKEVMNCYSEAARLAKVHAVDEGRMVPVEVMGEYQREVFPALARAVDDLHTALLNGVPAAARAGLERTWVASYPAFAEAMRLAGERLSSKLEELRGQAGGELVHTNSRTQVLSAKKRK